MTSIIFILDEFNGVSHNGYGFESGTLNILNGVINSFEILESGSGYVLKPYLIPVQANEYGIWQEDLSRNIAEVTTKTSDQLEEHLFDNFDRLGTYLANGYPDAGVYDFNATTYELLTDTSNSGFYAVSSWLDFEVNSTTGSGFHARVVETMLRDGSIKVVLENPGRGYLLPPQVILRGGEFLTTGKEDRRQPLQVTAGTKVLLLADTFDFDGDVKRVRFYANGVDLSIQTKRVLDSIQVTDAGSGYTAAPQVTLEGGGGNGAEAVAQLEQPLRNADGELITMPRGVASIGISDPGRDYFTAPNVIITGGGGGGAKANAKLSEIQEETFAQRLVSSLGRFGFEWTPDKPGTYLISLEVTDDDGEVTFIPNNAEVVVLPIQVSQVPQISLISDYNGMAFTNKSKLRFTARALDPDGKLEAVQFYVNGVPLGLPIESNYVSDQFQQPYSVEFSPTESGVYSIYATAFDNTGNYVMSDSVTFTSTEGLAVHQMFSFIVRLWRLKRITL